MGKMRAFVFTFCGLLAVGQPAHVWAEIQSHAVVVKAIKHALAPPLRQTKPIALGLSARVVRDRDAEQRVWNDVSRVELATKDVHRVEHATKDAVLEASAATSDSSPTESLQTNAGLDILGMGYGFPNYSIQDQIPSTNGAAGTTQFVQYVNASFSIFNKSNGSLIYGPADVNTLWQSLGAPCSNHDNMDGVAQFDKLANVWVMLMPLYGAPDLCVAVSTTSDATGSWNLYIFQLPLNSALCDCGVMPDYPKLAVWPDAYYISYHQAVSLTYEGPAACAVDRAAMLAGTAAPAMQCFFNDGTSSPEWLPSDLDGTTPPPSGTPNYFLAFDTNDASLDLWQFHVNWTTPSESTFTGPTNIAVPSFLEPCGDGVPILFTPDDNCVPQSGTSQMLGAFGDELMYRVAYRNFGSYQTLVANHTVQVASGSDQTGIRWYELQNTGSGFALYQDGTYAPDSNYRWMGSVAMDKAGDIAVGYNVSGSSMSPSIRYTGRVPTDPLGTMEGENDVLAAAGVESSSLIGTARWGDYSSLALDPSDDCTFWFTTEYIPPSTNHWATRINSFSFPNCTGAAPPAWTVVNKASGGGPHATNLTVPSTGTANLIAVAVMFNGTTSVSSISDNAGNTYVSAGARTNLSPWSVEIWYVASSKAGATLITPTFAGSPTDVVMSEWEVSGLATSGPDAVNTASGSVSTTTLGPAVTTTGTGDFVVSVILTPATTITGITSGNEFTDDFTTGGNGWAHITSDTSSPGTQQASWSASSATGKYLASTVAFFAAP